MPSLPRPHDTESGPDQEERTTLKRTINSWQIHTFFCRADSDGTLRYGLINFIHGDEVLKFAILRVGCDINFRHLLELKNLFDFRVKRLCTFISNELKEQDSEFRRDFPSAVPSDEALYESHKAKFGTIVQNMSIMLRNRLHSESNDDSVFDILSAAIAPQGLTLMKESVLDEAMKKIAFSEGFVNIQPQPVNKKIVLELLLIKEVTFFLMSRSTPPVDYVYDMVKLCAKAVSRKGYAQPPHQRDTCDVQSPLTTYSNLSNASRIEDIRPRGYIDSSVKLSVPPIPTHKICGGAIIAQGFTRFSPRKTISPSKLFYPDLDPESISMQRIADKRMDQKPVKISSSFSLLSVLLLLVIFVSAFGLFVSPTAPSFPRSM